MNQETIKKLISAYADGEADPHDAARAVEAIKSKKELKAYYHDIIRLKRTIRRLDDPSAYRAFKKAWRERIGITRGRGFIHTQVIRFAPLAAGVVIVAIGLLIFARQPSGGMLMKETSDEASFAVQQDMPEVMMQEAMPMEESAGASMASDTSAAEEAPLTAARGGAPVYELPMDIYDAFVSDLNQVSEDYFTEDDDSGRALIINAGQDATALADLLADYGITADGTDLSGQAVTVMFIQ